MTNGTTNTLGFYPFCTCASEGDANYDGSTESLTGYIGGCYRNSGRDQILHRGIHGLELPIQHAYFGGRAMESRYQMTLPTGTRIIRGPHYYLCEWMMMWKIDKDSS